MLCLLAVLGIALASFLAIGNQSMKLSNRSYRTSESAQLAETGLEEALRAFNQNDWSDWTNPPANVTQGSWSFDTTNRRATRTIQFLTGKLGQGVTGTINLRVDNYDAHVLGATWSTSKNYQIYDVVGYNGAWYTCLATHTSSSSNEPPNLAYWAEAPIPWRWSSDITYTGSRYPLVNYGGVWYRYISTSNSTSTTALSDPRYWRSIPAGLPLTKTWAASTVYYLNAVVSDGSNTYIAVVSPSHTSGSDFATDLAAGKWTLLNHGVSWQSSTTYALNNLVSYGGAWYYCSTAHISTTSFETSKWTKITPLSLTWATNTGFARGSVIFDSGSWYYCTTAHYSGTFSTDLADGKWVNMNSPASSTWTSGSSTPYFVGDYVYLSSTARWYRCIAAHTSGVTAPNSDATNWTNSSTYGLPNPYISWAYRSAATYEFNDVVFYSSSGSGTWYRRDVNSTTTNQAPTNTSYWENALTASWDWASGDNYNIGDVVNLSGAFYRCIRAHSNHTPPNTTYWSPDPLHSPSWDSGRAYSQYDTTYYRGSWYLSLQNSNVGFTPGTETTYWAVAPRSISAWDSTRNYSIDDFVSNGGTWYRCIKDTTANQATSNATYWVALTGSAYQWSAATAYTTSNYVSYGGVWYDCIVANTGQSPNNSTYWTPSWKQSWQPNSTDATGAPVIYAEGSVTLPDSSAPIKTQLRATINPASLFPNAVAATGTVAIGSGAGTVDSYDSTQGSYASPGGFSATIASSYTSNPAINITGTAAVSGYLAVPSASTTPFVPLYNTGGSVKGASTPGGTTIDPTRISRSPFIPLFDIQTPIQQTSIPTSLPSTTNSLNLGTPGAPTPSVYYYSTNLSIAASETVNINGPVILWINGYLRCNTGTLKITSTGSAQIYFTSYLRNYASSGGFKNLTQDPKKLVLIGNTANTLANYLITPNTTPDEFYGVIYMPNTTATLGLDIRTGNEIFGALSAKEITFSTEANVHYDTSLRYATFTGVDQPWAITEWRELTDPAERAVLP